MIRVVMQHNAIMNWSHIMRGRFGDLAREVGKQREGFNIGIAFPAALEQNEKTSILDDISQKGVWATGAALHAEEGDCIIVTDVQDVDPGPLTGLKGCFKIGMVHGGPHELCDFTLDRGPAYRPLFEAQLKCYDQLWVTTTYHSHLLQQTYRISHDKIKVVGLPLDVRLAIGESDLIPLEEGEEFDLDIPWAEKKDEVLFCSRQTKDKGYDLAMHLVNSTDLPVKIQRYSTRRGLYRALAEHKWVLIPSRRDTFGILASEAAMLGSVPLVPYSFCYPEILTQQWPFYLGEGKKYNEDLTPDVVAASVERIMNMEIPESEIDKHLSGAVVRYMQYDEVFDASVLTLFSRFAE